MLDVVITTKFNNIKNIYDLRGVITELSITTKDKVLCTLLDIMYVYIISCEWYDGPIQDQSYGEKYLNLFTCSPKNTISEQDDWEVYKRLVGEENIYSLQDIYKDLYKDLPRKDIIIKLKQLFKNALISSNSNTCFKSNDIYYTSSKVMSMINQLEITYNQLKDSSDISNIEKIFKERLKSIRSKRKIASRFSIDDHILAYYPDGNYYGARIIEVNIDNYKIKWDDGTNKHLTRSNSEVCEYDKDRDFNENNDSSPSYPPPPVSPSPPSYPPPASASAEARPSKRRRQNKVIDEKEINKKITLEVNKKFGKVLANFEEEDEKEINKKIASEVNKKFVKILEVFEKEIDTRIKNILSKTENSELGRITNLKSLLVEQIHSERETFNKLKKDADDVAKLRKSIRANINTGANSFAAHINTYTIKVTNDYNKWTAIVDSTTTNIYDIEKKFKESIKTFTASINQSVSTKVTSIGLDITRMSDKFKTLVDEQTLNIEGQSNTFIDCMKNIITKINEQITNMQKFMRIEIPQIKIVIH